MTWQVEWEPTALAAATRYLADDPSAVEALVQATDQLADDPQPAGSRPWGPDHRRLRRDRWRVLYRLDAQRHAVHIEHVGRTPQ